MHYIGIIKKLIKFSEQSLFLQIIKYNLMLYFRYFKCFCGSPRKIYGSEALSQTRERQPSSRNFHANEIDILPFKSKFQTFNPENRDQFQSEFDILDKHTHFSKSCFLLKDHSMIRDTFLANFRPPFSPFVTLLCTPTHTRVKKKLNFNFNYSKTIYIYMFGKNVT